MSKSRPEMIFLPGLLKLNNNHFHFHLLCPPVPHSPPPVLSCNPLGHFGFSFFFQLGWKYLTKRNQPRNQKT